jgi:hypothetical protein
MYRRIRIGTEAEEKEPRSSTEYLSKMFSAKVHAKHAKERSSCNSKVEASMAYNANTVTVNAWDIDHMMLYRKVKIVMAPSYPQEVRLTA